MKPRLAVAAVLLSAGMPAAAHRLDEYLQSTIISVQKDLVRGQLYLTPGVAVFPMIMASIDTDADGAISEAEQRAYTQRVLRDVSLTIDGERLNLRLVSKNFPDVAEMKQGRGEIEIEFIADLPQSGPKRRLIFENHHQTRIGAYLVNCLVPRDPDIRVTAQKRNYQQSLYELDYEQAGVGSGPRAGWWSSGLLWIWTAVLFLLARFTILWRQRALPAE